MPTKENYTVEDLNSALNRESEREAKKILKYIQGDETSIDLALRNGYPDIAIQIMDNVTPDGSAIDSAYYSYKVEVSPVKRQQYIDAINRILDDIVQPHLAAFNMALALDHTDIVMRMVDNLNKLGKLDKDSFLLEVVDQNKIEIARRLLESGVKMNQFSYGSRKPNISPRMRAMFASFLAPKRFQEKDKSSNAANQQKATQEKNQKRRSKFHRV